jgi:hypothetical protein
VVVAVQVHRIDEATQCTTQMTILYRLDIMLIFFAYSRVGHIDINTLTPMIDCAYRRFDTAVPFLHFSEVGEFMQSLVSFSLSLSLLHFFHVHPLCSAGCIALTLTSILSQLRSFSPPAAIFNAVWLILSDSDDHDKWTEWRFSDC